MDCWVNLLLSKTTGQAFGARSTGFEDKYFYGRNPTTPIIANYRNLHKQDTNYLGGFLTFVPSGRQAQQWGDGIGAELKDSLSEPGPWHAGMFMQGETIPKEANHVRLSKDQKDPWGIPQLITSVGYDDNDDKMVADFLEQSAEMLRIAGVKGYCTKRYPPGSWFGYS